MKADLDKDILLYILVMKIIYINPNQIKTHKR
jgi:hypothetical protein